MIWYKNYIAITQKKSPVKRKSPTKKNEENKPSFKKAKKNQNCGKRKTAVIVNIADQDDDDDDDDYLVTKKSSSKQF